MLLKELYTDINFYDHFLFEDTDFLKKRKIFFVLGAPGCGKNYIISQLFPPMKIIDIDNIFDLLVNKYKNIVTKLEKYRDYESPELKLLYDKAKTLMKKAINQYIKSNLAFIISATGKKYEKTKEMKKFFELNDYEIFLIFVDCDLNVALERNRKRGRTVPEEFLRNTYKEVKQSFLKYRDMFNDENVLIINNNSREDFERNKRYYMGMIRSFLKK